MYFHIFKKVVEEEGERLKNVVSGEDGQLFSTVSHFVVSVL